jgi:hypothetical protein
MSSVGILLELHFQETFEGKCSLQLKLIESYYVYYLTVKED